MSEYKEIDPFAELERELPPIIFRTWKRWEDFIPYSPRYVANMDSKGIGPVGKVVIDGRVGYERTGFVQFLRNKAANGKRGAAHID